jgi:hypothetical protein
MKLQVALIAVGVSALLVGPVAAADDRPPTAAERTKIEEALKVEGFTSWKDVEFDDNRWEIDDAVHTDGKVYDVYLSGKDMSVVFKTLND